MKTIQNIEFFDEVYAENSFGIVDNFGSQLNKMSFKEIQKNRYIIEWEVGDELAFEEIGIWTEGMKVKDYDGVFRLPIQAINLLKQNGFDTKEVEQ